MEKNNLDMLSLQKIITHFLSHAFFKKQSLRIVIFIVFITTIFIGLIQHEPWRDEVRVYAITLDGTSIFDIWNLMHFEGHPPLHAILIFLFAKIFGAQSIKIVCFLSIATFAWLVLRFSPFHILINILILLGNLFLFEYGIISRNHNLAIVSLLITVINYNLFLHKKNHYHLLIAIVFLIITNFISYPASIVSFLFFIYFYINHKKIFLRTNVLITSLIFISSFVIITIFVLPSDNSILTKVDLPVLQKFLFIVKNVLFHTPTWINELVPQKILNNNLLQNTWPFLISILLFSFSLETILFLLLYYALSSIDMAFHSLSTRQFGLLLFLAICFYWLNPQLLKKNIFSFIKSKGSFTLFLYIFFNKIKYIVIILFLFWQMLMGLEKFYTDVRFNYFTNSKQVANYINSNKQLSQAIILSEPDVIITPLRYYLDNKFYFAREHKYGNYPSFHGKIQKTLSLDNLLLQAKILKQASGFPVIILLYYQYLRDNLPQTYTSPYGSIFYYDNIMIDNFTKQTIFLREFSTAKNDFQESYKLYLVK